MKKLICLCFALALILSLTVPVFAADTLGVIEITLMQEPAGGLVPTFAPTLAQSDVAQIASTTWMDLSTDTYMDGTVPFQHGGSYRLEITVLINDPGTVWSGNTILGTINGKAAECWRIDDVYAMVQMDYELTIPEGHSCTGGYATCTDPAICTICGKPYGQPNPNNHDIFGRKKADTDPNVATHHDLYCDLCRKTLQEEAHSWGPLNGNNVHPCTVCWYEPTPAAESTPHTCTGGQATCSEQAWCTICNKPYGQVDPNAHRYGDTYAFTDDTGHSKACQICGKASATEAHVPDKQDKTLCKLCGYPIPQATAPTTAETQPETQPETTEATQPTATETEATAAATEETKALRRQKRTDGSQPQLLPIVIIGSGAAVAAGGTAAVIVIRKKRFKMPRR